MFFMWMLRLQAPVDALVTCSL